MTERERLDASDLAIIDFLQLDGRAAPRRVASALGLEENRVRRSIARLRRENLIRICALPNFPGSADLVITLVLLNVGSNVLDIANTLGDWPQIPWLCECAGDADIALTIYASDLISTGNVLARISGLPGLERMRSYVGVDTVKVAYLPPQATLDWDASATGIARNPESIEAADALGIAAVAEWLRERVDALDMKIIERLSSDGRTPYTDIARSLGLVEATVRKRTKRLIEHNIIRIAAVPTEPLGDETFAALIRMNTTGDPRPITETIAEWTEVGWVAITAGDTCIAFDVVCASRGLYLELIERTRSLPSANTISSLVILRTLKKVYLGPVTAKATQS
jgi:DNA-binding Lrp family transcriptional regulator